MSKLLKYRMIELGKNYGNFSNWLYKEYLIKGRSVYDICRELKMDKTTLKRLLEIYDIRIRTISEQMKIHFKRYGSPVMLIPKNKNFTKITYRLANFWGDIQDGSIDLNENDKHFGTIYMGSTSLEQINLFSKNIETWCGLKGNINKAKSNKKFKRKMPNGREYLFNPIHTFSLQCKPLGKFLKKFAIVIQRKKSKQYIWKIPNKIFDRKNLFKAFLIELANSEGSMEDRSFSFGTTNLPMLIQVKDALKKHFGIESHLKKLKNKNEIKDELKEWRRKVKNKEKLNEYILRIFGLLNLKVLNEIFNGKLLSEKQLKLKNYLRNTKGKFKLLHPEIYSYAINLNKQGYGHIRAAIVIKKRFGLKVPLSTLSNWFYKN